MLFIISKKRLPLQTAAFVKAFYYPLYAFSLTTTDALLSVVSSFDNNRCTGNYAAYKQQGKP